MNLSSLQTFHSHRHSVLHCIAHQSEGLLKPLTLQRSIISYFMHHLELSRHKDVQRAHASAINDVNIDITENRYLLSGGSDGTIAIHDLEDLKESELNNGLFDSRTYRLVCSVSPGNRDAHKRSIETVQWYPLDTGIFTSSGTDRLLKIWDANILRTAEEYSFNGIVHCHHMSSITTKHNLIAVGTDSSIVKLVDPRAGSATHSLRGHKEGAVRSVCWSNRDEFLLATGGVDNFAMLWDVRTAKGCLMKLQDKKKKKSGFTPDTTHDGSVNGLHFTGDGLYLATIGTDQKLFLWDVHTGKKLPIKYPAISHIKKRSVKFHLTKGGSENFAFIPTGSSISMFNITSPASKSKHLYGHYNSVNCCTYHEQGNQLISGGNDHKILIWTHKGDQSFDEFLCDEQVEKMNGGKRVQVSESPAMQPLPESLAQTLDTWSDDEDDASQGTNSVHR
ncbi:DNA excision repair protein ERCC-8 [Bulinus truncatus]|nr:DNA excision repair protein ERCC-8 [Bulinus truncatus]